MNRNRFIGETKKSNKKLSFSFILILIDYKYIYKIIRQKPNSNRTLNNILTLIRKLNHNYIIFQVSLN